MPLPKSLTQPLRQSQLVVGSGWRAYFAPFNQQLAVSAGSSILGPTIYDLQVTNKFIDSTGGPPPGWFDLGYVRNFTITPGSKIGNVTTGYRGAIRAKYRAEVSEKMQVEFVEMTHMALKVATGTQVFNLLYPASGMVTSSSGPLSSSGTSATPLGASGYQATGIGSTATAGLPTLFVPSGSGAAFQAGQYIVCDDDYDGTSFGFVGDAGANVFQGAVSDTDFIRKTSDYVACIKQIATGVAGQDALILTGPIVGGGMAPQGATPNTAPGANAKIQRIVGYATREGGTYIKEWSAVMVLDTIDASQLLWYYPRVSPESYGGVRPENLQNATSLQLYPQQSSFDALAFDDPLDGETVVRYMAYYPAATLRQNIQI